MTCMALTDLTLPALRLQAIIPRMARNPDLTGKMVPMTADMAEYVRMQAFMQRKPKQRLIEDALEAYYQSDGRVSYPVEKMSAWVFMRFAPDELARLQATALMNNASMNEIIRLAIAYDAERKGVAWHQAV